MPINSLSLKIIGTLYSTADENCLVNDNIEEHPNDAVNIKRLRALVADQKPLLESALQVHGARVSQTQVSMHEWLEKCFSGWQSKHYADTKISIIGVNQLMKTSSE